MTNTLSERIDVCIATQDLLKFPSGSPTHEKAALALALQHGSLIELMEAQGVSRIYTKTAAAILDEHGIVWVSRNEELPI